MLLRHDSLEYATNYLADAFPGSTGLLVGGAYEKSGRTCLFSSNGVLPVQLPTPQDTTCVVGFLLKVETASTPLDGTTLVDFLSQGGSLKLKARMVTGSAGYRLVFETADGGSRILSGPELPYNTWHYLEIRVVFAVSQGSIVLRVNGTETSRAENATTDPNIFIGWGGITFYLQATPAVFRIADLYVCDGSGSERTYRTFIGKTMGRRLAPFTLRPESFGWGPTPSLGGKYRLVVMLGQSNMQGLGLMPPESPASWRSTNPFLPIWNKLSGAFEPLQAGVNSASIFTTNPRWGMEMMFAERLAQMLEASGSSPTTSNFRLVKAAQDGSTVMPQDPLVSFITWDPGTTNSLYIQTVAELQLAVASLGGASAIEQIDYVWFQGETEGILSLGIGTYPGEYFSQTISILLGFYSLFPAPSNLHIVQIHKSIPEQYPGGVVVRARQRILKDAVPSGSFLDIDYASTGSDRLHLDEKSLNNIGEQLFSAWLPYQQFADYWKDEYFFASTDSKWIGSNSAGKSVSMEQVSSFLLDMVHAPVLAASSKVYAGSTSDGKSLKVTVGKSTVSSTLLSNASEFTAIRSGGALMALPEDMSGFLSLEIF